MPIKKLVEFLDSHNIKYEKIIHSQAFTAQEIAASAHLSGKELAKTVMIKVNGNMAMAVIPASYKVNLDLLRKESRASRVNLAKEEDFKDLFPGCEIGAMPPFGNLYEIPVYVAEKLAEDEKIAFNAGSHTELIKLSFRDYKRLVNPRIVRITTRK
jgi:Ala-tRNA(Pro) deacylase